MDFNEIFFSKEYSGNSPLFIRQKEIIEVYERLKKNHVKVADMTAGSLRTSISKLVTKNRGVSEKMKPILMEIVKFRIQEPNILQEIESDLDVAIQVAKNKSIDLDNQQESNYEDIMQEEFERVCEYHGEHCIITDYPIEINDTHVSIERRKTILTRLHLTKDSREDFFNDVNQRRITTIYIYLIWDRSNAIKLWKKLFETLVNDLNFLNGKSYEEKYNEASDRFDLLCQQNYLRTFYIDKISASHNLYIHDGTKDKSHMFKFYQMPNFNIQVFKIPDFAHVEIMKSIYHSIFTKIDDKNNKVFGLEEFKPKRYGRTVENEITIENNENND